MKRFVFVSAFVLAVAEMGAIGCNAILGNEPGALAVDASSSSSCAAGQKSCGTCVAVDDPKVGCGGACTVCATPTNGQATCELQNSVETCALGTCNPQFGNCDNNTVNGCETHTTTKENCGQCGASCDPQPYCEPDRDAGAGYRCSDTCDPPNKTCGSECVDEQTDNGNCGGCNINCAVANGQGVCNAGQCQIQCSPNYFLCNGACAPASADLCGASCAPCPSGFSCDTSPGSQNYGACTSSGSADAGCSTGVICHGSCSVESVDQCGPACNDCHAAGGTDKGICLNHACACSSGVACGSGSNFWCCDVGSTCGPNSGLCNPVCVSGCEMDSGACGCSNGVSCISPNTSSYCGTTCDNCAIKSQCCCPNTGDYTCEPKIDGGGGGDGGLSCPPGCN